MLFVIADEVEITGILMQRWNSISQGQLCDVDVVLLAFSAHHFQERVPQSLALGRESDDFARYWLSHTGKPLAGRNEIVASICPQVAPIDGTDMLAFCKRRSCLKQVAKVKGAARHLVGRKTAGDHVKDTSPCSFHDFQ